MSNEEMETCLNAVIEKLRSGLLSVAEKVRDGSREEIAYQVTLMAETVCEHWPNCFENHGDASQKA